AARFVRGGALAALCRRSRGNPHWLALRVLSGVVGFLFLSRAFADALDEECDGDQADRWVAPDCRMDVARSDLHPCRRSDGSCFRLSGPHPAKDAARSPVTPGDRFAKVWRRDLAGAVGRERASTT